MAAASVLILPLALISPAPLLWWLRRFGSPVIDRSEIEELRGVALHVEDFGLHAVPFLFLPIEHSAFKVLILLGISLSDATPAIEPFHSFKVLNLVVLIEERYTEC